MSRIEFRAGPDAPVPSTLAISGIWFAASMMLLIGTFEILAGLGAILDDNFFTPTHHYTFNLSVTAWGWIHLVLGILLVVVGYFVLQGSDWARGVGIGLAVLSAIANFLALPYYPLWAILIITLDVLVIWGLSAWRPDRA